jgi:3-hydroxy-9,10-secoandrosta-1,3,5(10)-triene-9,17-dione monooxygenase
LAAKSLKLVETNVDADLRGLCQIAKEKAFSTDENRKIDDEIAKQIKVSKILRTLVPKNYGGHGLGPEEMILRNFEVAQACGSTGWCTAVYMLTNWQATLFHEKAQEEYFAIGPDAIGAAVGAPGGTAKAVGGGFIVNARWRYASGVNHCDWFLGAAVVAPENYLRHFMLRRSDISIIDTWNSEGLRGTGSNEVVCEEVFVPDFRSVVHADFLNAKSEGILSPNASPNAKLNWVCVGSLALASAAHGSVRGLIALTESAMKIRKLPYDLGTQAAHPVQQIRLAESIAEHQSAEVLMLEVARRTCSLRDDPTIATTEELTRLRMLIGFAAKLNLSAAQRIPWLSSAGDNFKPSHSQVIMRNLNAMSLHQNLNFDFAAESYARLRLGLLPTKVRV